MHRTRNACSRAGAWIAGEPGAELFGKFLTAPLIAAIIAIVLAIVYVGATHAIADIRAEDVGRQLRAIVIIVIGIVAFAAAVAVVPPLIRSLWEQVGWWTNVFRLLALTVIVFAVWVAAPLVLPQLPGGRWFAWDQRTERDVVGGEPVGLVPPSPHALPSGIAAIRRGAISERYWRFLAKYGDEGLRRRYERVKQWRSLTEEYAAAAGLDASKVEAVMMTESAGQPEITSRANARGLMQVMDEGALHRAELCGTANPRVDSYDPEKSICAGTDELRSLANVKYRGDWENVLAAYNWGVGNLERAFDRLQRHWPDEQRSFWVLREKVDPKSGDRLLPPDETRSYVPSVLAWEYIIRYMDAHDGTPPPRDGNREPPLLARRGPAPRPLDEAVERWEDAEVWAIPPTPQPEQPAPRSNVWYATRAGDNFGGVVRGIFKEDPSAIVELNPDILAAGLAVSPGTVIRLPEERYAFYQARGDESYRDIAVRHGMTTSELLSWAGRWTAADVWAAAHRDCPPEGCDDELVLASTGEQLLVRRRN
ncbi:transglycosylase SLT domain-containing protein [Candidatus Uhrbacteria bacterium]|nr:transglycosylase SLT domain-containing protein [Candidatus Uhrbacteria bacterium]